MASSRQHRIRIFGISLLAAPCRTATPTSATSALSGDRGRVGDRLCACFIAAPTAEAQTYTVVYNFTGGGDGANPEAEARNVNPRKNLGSR